MKHLILLLALSGCAITGAHKEEAEKQAHLWANKMELKDPKIHCVSDDSDGDGYVSCTILSQDKIHSIECTGAFTLNDGCRAPKLRLRN